MNSRLTTVRRGLFLLAWGVNVALWCGLAWWVATQPEALREVQSSKAEALTWLVPTESPGYSPAGNLWLQVAMATAAGTGVLMLLSVVFGSPGFRSVRTWLLLMVATAAWLTLGLGIGDLHWQGQQIRVSRNLDSLSAFAADLKTNWPQDDGESDDFGPFLAYPHPRPTSLLLVGSPTLPGTTLTLSAIELSPDGGVLFELAGGEQPGWLEWQPTAAEPKDFVSGLQTHYELERAAKLSPHWYLVHYRVGR